MSRRFYRRRWEESRGDEYEAWGHSVWYAEVGEDGWPLRQVEVYDAGPTLRYDVEHAEDEYGQLGDASLFGTGEDWSRFEIREAEFEQAWSTAGVVSE